MKKNGKKQVSTITLPSLAFLKGIFFKPQLNSTKILINGKLLTCIGLSIVSGLIDLVFFSNISKSLYELFGYIAIPAGLLMAFMSIWFSAGKFFVATQLAALSELKTRLLSFGYSWGKSLTKPQVKWHIVHKLLIALSILTSISLSSISIGTGISKKAQMVNTLTEYIEEGKQYKNINNAIRQTMRTSTLEKASSGGSVEKNADKQAELQTSLVWEEVSLWQQEYNTITYNTSSKEKMEELNGLSPYEYWSKKNGKLRTLLAQNDYTGPTSEIALSKLNRSAIKTNIRDNLIVSGNVDTDRSDRAVEDLKQFGEEDMLEAKGWLKKLNAQEIIDPNTGNVVKFNESGEVISVLVGTAISKLEVLRQDWINDTGDTGSSAKIFTQIGEMIAAFTNNASVDLNNVVTNQSASGSLGPTELMMMVFIMFSGILCEFLIALFTPKAAIDRKLLSQFNQYFDIKDFDINKFMFTVYKDYLDIGIISQKEFDLESKKCINLSEITFEDALKKYSKYKTKTEKIKEVKVEAIPKREIQNSNEKLEKLNEALNSFEKDLEN